jgi:hypothetical protein
LTRPTSRRTGSQQEQAAHWSTPKTRPNNYKKQPQNTPSRFPH